MLKLMKQTIDCLINLCLMKRTPYTPPLCEYNNYSAVAGMLAGSELTDDGAGEFLIPGDEFNF